MGGRKGREVEGEAAAIAVVIATVVVKVTAVWFMACGKSTKDCQDYNYLFLLSYIALKR